MWPPLLLVLHGLAYVGTVIGSALYFLVRPCHQWVRRRRRAGRPPKVILSSVDSEDAELKEELTVDLDEVEQ